MAHLLSKQFRITSHYLYFILIASEAYLDTCTDSHLEETSSEFRWNHLVGLNSTKQWVNNSLLLVKDLFTTICFEMHCCFSFIPLILFYHILIQNYILCLLDGYKRTNLSTEIITSAIQIYKMKFQLALIFFHFYCMVGFFFLCLLQLKTLTYFSKSILGKEP